MATRKRSRPDTEDVSRPSSATADLSPTSMSNFELAIANKRARQSAPVYKIINVVELCEQVLSHLPMYDLIHAMQACRAFKATIQNSSRLQKNLFLAADTPHTKFAMSRSGTLLSGIRAEQQIAAVKAVGKRPTGEFACCTLHPALKIDPQSYRLLVPENKREGMVRYASQRFKSPRQLHTTDDAVIRGSVWSLTEEGSKSSGLDSMLITQPPVKSVEILMALGGGACASDSVSNRAGVTFGDVFKTITKITAGSPYRRSGRWWISFDSRVFVLNAEAREAVERAGEMSSEDDPTRMVFKDGSYVLKEGGFNF